MKKIVDCETGEVVERELTAEEIEQEQIDQELMDTARREFEARMAARAALLDRLGLTEDEAKLILG